MSEQEARETACAIFGGNGDFYSFRKKPKSSSSSSSTTINESVKSKWSKANFNILEDGFSKIERFYNDSVLWRVLWKKIEPNLYLVNTLL